MDRRKTRGATTRPSGIGRRPHHLEKFLNIKKIVTMKTAVQETVQNILDKANRPGIVVMLNLHLRA